LNCCAQVKRRKEKAARGLTAKPPSPPSKPCPGKTANDEEEAVRRLTAKPKTRLRRVRQENDSNCVAKEEEIYHETHEMHEQDLCLGRTASDEEEAARRLTAKPS